MDSNSEVFYWMYTDHPDSPDEEFLYDGVLVLPSSHHAHAQSQEIIQDLDIPETEYDLGVHIVTPATQFVEGIFEDNIDNIPFEDIVGNNSVLSDLRDMFSEEEIREVASRQEKFDKVEFGEDVDGVIEIPEEEL